jgi:hypothetical protein
MLRPRRVGGRWVLARTGAIGGPAYSVAKCGAQPDRPQHSDRNRAIEPADAIEQIKELNELREQGILTDGEFAAEKQKLLEI